MSTKKPVMGRGLEALLGQMSKRPEPAPEAGSATPPPPAKLPGDELANLPLDLLQRGKYQPRVDMRQESLEELAASIKSQGIIQPIVVRAVDGAAPGASQRYEIIAGERRWRAAQIAGLATIPAVIRKVPDEAAIAMALIENIQREDLNPLEEARALERLISEFGITHQQAADAVGRSRAAVSNLLRLLELAPEITAFVERRELEMGHARALLALTQRRQQVEVGTLVAKRGLSVRDTEGMVRGLLARASGGSAPERQQGSRSQRPAPAGRADGKTRRAGADPAHAARAREKSSSAITRSMSSTASSRTFASALARAAVLAGCASPARAASCSSATISTTLSDWHIEAEKPGRISAANGVLDIDVPAGVTLWFKPRLEGPLTIEFEATAVAEGGPNDQVSDLNVFWMANNVDGRQPVFAHERSGAFAEYNDLLTYYVGLGGNRNTTTRFRRYIGDPVLRPAATRARPERGIRTCSCRTAARPSR